LQCGIAPDYALDRMEVYEIEALIENLWMKNKESWEQARTISYITAQCQSTKQLDMKSMMPFVWEKETKQEITQEERDQMWKEMKEMENRLNKK
jgi:hypothetical protein